jgi:hypothetical protein
MDGLFGSSSHMLKDRFLVLLVTIVAVGDGARCGIHETMLHTWQLEHCTLDGSRAFFIDGCFKIHTPHLDVGQMSLGLARDLMDVEGQYTAKKDHDHESGVEDAFEECGGFVHFIWV